MGKLRKLRISSTRDQIKGRIYVYIRFSVTHNSNQVDIHCLVMIKQVTMISRET